MEGQVLADGRRTSSAASARAVGRAPWVVAAAVAVLVAPKRLRRPAAVGVVGSLVLVELEGPTGPAAPVLAHLVSLVASGVIAIGWSAGVWHELLRRETG